MDFPTYPPASVTLVVPGKFAKPETEVTVNLDDILPYSNKLAYSMLMQTFLCESAQLLISKAAKHLNHHCLAFALDVIAKKAKPAEFGLFETKDSVSLRMLLSYLIHSEDWKLKGFPDKDKAILELGAVIVEMAKTPYGYIEDQLYIQLKHQGLHKAVI